MTRAAGTLARHPFLVFVIRRIVLGALVLFAVSVVVFAATQALPGDPASAILGKTATPERIHALRAQLHLDSSLLSQYGRWAGGLLHGDLGSSIASQGPVSALLGQRVANTLTLVVVAGVIAIPLSLAIGVISAVRRDRLFDQSSAFLTLVLAAFPEFVIGICLILLLSTSMLRLFPPVSLIGPGVEAWQVPSALVLPALALILAVIPYISRIMRASMIEIMESDYVQMARLRGLSEKRIVFRHALPNAIAPAIQVSALQIAWLTGGVVVIEYLFQFRGIGSLLVEAVANHDLQVVQAVTLIAAATYVLFNLIADVVIIASTPKLRSSYARREPVLPTVALATEGGSV